MNSVSENAGSCVSSTESLRRLEGDPDPSAPAPFNLGDCRGW